MGRPMKTLEQKLWAKVDKSGDCWVWLGAKAKTGYGHFSHGRKKTIGVHRASFFIHNGYWPAVVMHTCDNPSCVNPDHLKGGTQRDNMLDMIAKGRQSKNLNHANRLKGVEQKNAKLDEDKVRVILCSSLSQRKLALMYGVSRRCIAFVQQRKTWKHVKLV